VVPGYGREPVGNGHAAAGFNAGLALGIAAFDGSAADAAIDTAGLATGLAAFIAFFFFPAFFFFLADFFLPAAFSLLTS
jgi:VIT1/CCC1 family predicted Fe2+/Mn2+ transporter